MTLSIYLIPILIFLLVVVFGCILLQSLSTPSRPFPPGPTGLPIIGNLHQIPLSKSYLQFASWGEVYGPITGLRIGSSKTLVLNTWRAVSDLLDKRGQIYSSRPHVPVVQLVAGDHHTAFQPYGPKWRRGRQTFTDFLKDSEVEERIPIQEAEAAQLMWEVLHNPGKYRDAVKRYFGAIILASVHGMRGKQIEGGPLRRFYDIQEEWANILDLGQTPPYNALPWLKFVPDWMTPWRGWRTRADNIRKARGGLYQDLMDDVKKRLESGMGANNFMAGLLRMQEKDRYNDDELRSMGGLLLEAGADTTTGVCLTLILALASYPEVQKRAQEEVDRVFGSERMPCALANKEPLPFIRACVLEALRWRPNFPTAVPHATTKDDVYGDYFIPKDTVVILNTWGLHHDPNEYEDPDVFDPTRFLISKVEVKDTDPPVDNLRRDTYAFGSGRRICPGQKMAETSLITSLSKLVWCFDIIAKEPIDVDVKTAFTDGIIVEPREFPVEFKVREDKKAKVIENEWFKANEFLKKYE